jgi:hypothetical protein
LVIDTVVRLTLAKWEAVSGQFGGYLKHQERDSSREQQESKRPTRRVDGSSPPYHDLGSAQANRNFRIAHHGFSSNKFVGEPKSERPIEGTNYQIAATGKCDWIACYLKPDMAQVFDSLSISKIL